MSVEPVTPQRPLIWPPFVEQLSSVLPEPGRVYLVGGAVRDALRGRPIHDFDLATPDSGREVARRIANRMGGKYYTLDEGRDVGRALATVEDRLTRIDVAKFRGSSLLTDLQGRDFTINAMAVRLDRLDALIDPLDGQGDLFVSRLLRQCSPASIADDPVRAIRAVRHAVQIGLRIDTPLLAAVRAARNHLVDSDGAPLQPERIRDELFKLLEGAKPAAALRVMRQLGLLDPLGLGSGEDSSIEHGLVLAEALSNLVAAISPQRDDNTASDLTLGTAVMVLDRFRGGLQAQLAETYAEDRKRTALLYIACLAPPNAFDWNSWATTLALSNPEKRFLADLQRARLRIPGPTDAEDRRTIYRYFEQAGEAGVDAVLFRLAEFIASHLPTPDAVAWGELLEHVASPLLGAYFHHYHEIVAPPVLLTGGDLQHEFGLRPGPQIGQMLGRLQEEQAAGDVRTREEALRFVKRLHEQRR